MASANDSPLLQQVARVSRRLFLQTLLDALAWCWAGAFLLATIWFLVDPFLGDARPEWVRWAVAGGLFGVGSILAVGIAVLRAPTRLAAALSLDERFGLKERVTTSLTLDPHLRNTPAAKALLADAASRVARLDVGDRFPVQVRWTAALVPLAGLALAGVALFYAPQATQANTTEDEVAKAPVNKQEIEDKMKDLAKKAKEKREAEKLKNEKADPLDEELQKILNRPRETKDDVKDRIKDLTNFEEKLKAKQDQLSEKAQAVKDQLQQMNKLASNDPKEGPAKDLQKALEKGDFKKAQEEVERLAKKLQEGKMTDQEKEQLKKQMEQLKQKMQQMADPKAAEEKLQELKRQGKIDEQQFQKALDQIKKNAQKMSEDDRQKMEELADALKECEKCMKEGDSDKAADALKKAGQALRKMDDLEQMEALDEQLDQLRDAKRCMCKGMNSQPVPGDGRRPESDPHDTKSFTTRIKGDFDPKGQKELTGFAPGTAFKKKSSAEISGAISQAAQEAPEALERQRIPRAASDMAKGYFENFRKMTGEEEKK